MKLEKGLRLIIGLGVAVSGCASFEPALRYQDLTRPRQPTVRVVQEGLEVSVEEFVSGNKSSMAFDAEIAQYGVLPLLVRADNKGTKNYTVSRSDITATLGEATLPQLKGEEAASEAATREYAGKALGWTLATGPFAILLWPATIGGSAAHTHAVNRQIQQHFESMQFADAMLLPNQSAVGFVYFKLPDKVDRLEKLAVNLQAYEQETRKQIPFTLSCPTLSISGTAVASGASAPASGSN
jgi:hypothetical protein